MLMIVLFANNPTELKENLEELLEKLVEIGLTINAKTKIMLKTK